MWASKSKLAAVMFSVALFALFAVVVFVSPADAVAAVSDLHPKHLLSLDHMTFAEVGLVALRSRLTDLETRAAAKQAEVRDGMNDAELRKIETDHQGILDEIAATRSQIADAERAAPTDAGAVAAERTRSAEITTLSQRHAMPEGFAADHINRGTGLDQVRQIVLDEVAKRSADTRISPRVQVTQDEGDTIRTAVETSILHRANPSAVTLDDAARQWRGMSLLEAGREYVSETAGVKLRGLSKREQASVLLGLERRAGMMATTDFPQLLANVASRRLRDAYNATTATWKPLARQSNAPDFKERAIVQMSGMPELKKVREGQEYTYASLGESVEKYAIATYGRIIAITRQTLINDDLGAFDRLPTMFGRAAAELEADLVWDIFLSNPVMGDGKALFHADHGNLVTPGSDITEESVNKMEIALGEQTDAAGKPMNLRPAYLVVPPKYQLQAKKLLTAVSAGKTSDVNVYQNSMSLIVEQRLKAKTGASPWFMSADPAVWDTVEYAYLEGEEGLYTEERVGFEVDGIEVKGRLDFGAKAIDWRAFQKNPGVA